MKFLRRAILLGARALRADPGDSYLAGWLLDLHARTPRDALVDLFREPEVTTPVLAALEAAAKSAPADARAWRRLATFFALQPGVSEQGRQFEDRATALELAAQDQARVSGKVLAAGRLSDVEMLALTATASSVNPWLLRTARMRRPILAAIAADDRFMIVNEKKTCSKSAATIHRPRRRVQRKPPSRPRTRPVCDARGAGPPTPAARAAAWRDSWPRTTPARRAPRRRP